MELTDYVRILQKRWWIILVAVALTAGSAWVFSKFQDPEYTSTAEVIIEPARPDWGLTQSSKMMLRTYMTVIDSDQYAQKVIQAFDEAEAGGSAAIQLEGKFIDYPVVERCKRVLKIAKFLS